MTHSIARCSAVLGMMLVAASAAPAQGPQASVTISDVTLVEGSGPNSTAVFTVRLVGEAPAGMTVTMTYSTAPGTAAGGSACSNATDYVSVGQTALTLTAADRVKTIPVTVCGDPHEEPDEAFFVNLVNTTPLLVGVSLQDTQGRATISNDDQQPHIRIADATVTERRPGDLTEAFLTVTLSTPGKTKITPQPLTVNRTATGSSPLAPCDDGDDYESEDGIRSMIFEPGDTVETLRIRVCTDNVPEATEQFEVRLSLLNPEAVIEDGVAVVTILDDDVTTVSVADAVPVAEPSASSPQPALGVFVVTLEGGTPAQPVTVQYATQPVTATGGSACQPALETAPDFLAQTGTLTFTPGGPRTQSIGVPVCPDGQGEPAETFTMTLTRAANATIVRATGKATIK
jgi:hypothetical protein